MVHGRRKARRERATARTPSGSQDNYKVGDDDFRKHLAVLCSRPRPITVVGPRMDWEQQRKVYERLALYRIRARKRREGVSIDKLDDRTLKEEYPPQALEEAYYFSDYDQDGTIDWYFDPDLSVHSYLSDYHRLVLKNGDGTRYLDWEKYCSWFTTYETDEEYLKYFEEISKRIKWIKRYMEFEGGSPEWISMEAIGFRQAVEIAVDFPHMSYDLVFTAYMDHISNTRFDYFDREETDPLLFEIWKRAAKQKITFRKALDQIQQVNMFPRHEKCIQFILDNSSTYTRLQYTFDTCVEGISDETPEDEGRMLITKAVWSKLHKEKTWDEYIKEKIQIAKHIGLDLQATCIPI
ncbi:uncharacterized protein LOC123433579 [Hordeum vulgare subsp. vulgare]|uniref:Predicted protein n=1 Tax=Hordeum vulgare subsp. vulgare TaxID=112509 RepID=F2DFH4_HORVV|nr:uncharacterized protein LOC123433579 [Hordeum vulgare subsp. vulgare]BAJ93845.1 predicted protein [Hordeum vulgare subsp. vulgare]